MFFVSSSGSLTSHFMICQNFVGLSVANGYITCGSETNEVCMPFLSLFQIGSLLLLLFFIEVS